MLLAMTRVVVALLAFIGTMGLGCRVNETLCMDAVGNELDPRSGCVTHDSTTLPAGRCLRCPDDGCGIDLSCAKSSCVADPQGRIYVLFCVDASIREWPAGWRPIRRRDVPTDPALTDVQRSTCLSAAVHDRYCKGR